LERFNQWVAKDIRPSLQDQSEGCLIRVTILKINKNHAKKKIAKTNDFA